MSGKEAILKKYLLDKVNPIFERLIVDILIEMPN